MKTVAHGVKRLVRLQLKEVTWKCCNTHMRRVVHGMHGLALKQLEVVTWKCSNT